MITDAMLREAAAEAERFMLAHLPEVQEPHVFSKRFERKMQKLISRMKHPVRYQVMRYVAAVLLAIITLFGAVLAVSPEARATVIGWVRSTFHEYFEYENDNTDDPIQDEYELAVVPDGYSLLNEINKANGKMYLYVDDSGNMLQFTYAYGEETDSLYIETELYRQHSGNVHGMLADIYIAVSENETSVIVWHDRQTEVLFHVFAKSDQDELIKIAESVRKKRLRNL